MMINLFLIGKPELNERGSGKKFSEVYKEDFVLPEGYQDLFYYAMPDDYFYYFILSSVKLGDVEEGVITDIFSAIGDVGYQEEMVEERDDITISNMESDKDLITGFTMNDKIVKVTYMGSGWNTLE
jgi:hypothetical protein